MLKTVHNFLFHSERKGEIWVDMPHLGEKEALPGEEKKTLTREERERLLLGRETLNSVSCSNQNGWEPKIEKAYFLSLNYPQPY